MLQNYIALKNVFRFDKTIQLFLRFFTEVAESITGFNNADCIISPWAHVSQNLVEAIATFTPNISLSVISKVNWKHAEN